MKICCSLFLCSHVVNDVLSPQAKLRRDLKKKKHDEETESEAEASGHSKSKPAGPRLVARMKELLANGVGADVLMCSSSRNTSGGLNKICLDMQNNNSSTDKAESKKSKSKASSAVSKQSDGDSTGGSAAGHSLAPGCVGVVSGQGVLGTTMTGSFKMPVPRECWTHVAFVASRKPKNRITCYLVRVSISRQAHSGFMIMYINS